MIEILICDDDTYINNSLSSAIQKYLRRNNLQASIMCFNSGEAIIQYLENAKQQSRLIFLDIELGSISGIDVAHFIRHILEEHTSEIIYITGTYGYERKLFEFAPAGFLAKPIEDKSLSKVLSQVLKRMKLKRIKFFYEQFGIKKSVVLDEILYFESFGRKIYFHSRNREDWFYKKISTLVSELNEYPQFIQTHRSYIVNLNHVSSIGKKEVQLDTFEKLPLSSRRKTFVEARFFQIK